MKPRLFGRQTLDWVIVGVALATVAVVLFLLAASCAVARFPQPPPSGPAAPPAQADPQPQCGPGQSHSCWNMPPGYPWLFACAIYDAAGNVVVVENRVGPEQCPRPISPPAPAPTETDCDGPVGAQLGVQTSLGDAVNAAILRAYGCDGGRCVVNETRFKVQRTIINELRKAGLCAGQHNPGVSDAEYGTDEIAVSTSRSAARESYHVAVGLKEGPVTLLLSPQGAREAYLPVAAPPPAGPTPAPPAPPAPPTPTPAPPAPPPAPPAGGCNAPPCPRIVWTPETLPPGWDSNLIGKPAWHFNSADYPKGIGWARDFTPIQERNPDFCVAVGFDNPPRLDCPLGKDGDPKRPDRERYLLGGGFVREGKDGADCRPLNETRDGISAPSMIANGTGRCRMCSAHPVGDPLRVCSEYF
jgi:hypothetical protein